MKSAAGSAADFVKDSISGGAPSARPSGFGGHDYSANLDQQPEAFMAGDDDSDEDIGGKPEAADTKDSMGLDYDSDERNDDEELVAVSGSTPSNELIDLGGGTESGGRQAKAAVNIPKLSGPQ